MMAIPARTHLAILIIATFACLLGGCASPEDSESGGPGPGSEAFKFEVRTYDPADPLMKPINQVVFVSRSQPLGVSWEGAPVERFAKGGDDPKKSNFRAVPIGGKPDKQPWTFAINGHSFAMTDDDLRSGGQTWVLKREPLEINLDDLPRPEGK
jgi:hypothetical protein